MRFRHLFAACATLAVLAIPSYASAFCGFYVAGGDTKLFNDATQVVLMRYGTRTILSMQNNYEGPPEDFAMVVPVPEVLKKTDVKTLDKEIFDKIDRLTAPRLVEYWEQDPCRYRDYGEGEPVRMSVDSAGGGLFSRKSKKPKVKVEAKFSVGEYDIVVLSAEESTALDTWLRQNDYDIPEGAEPYLAPYVEGGMYFFVAKVNTEKVRYVDGRAVLSPLRFHYESDAFQLPIRLGMINSQGKQDLIVYILARRFRYQVVNYPTAYIPTNVNVRDGVRDRFGDFYRALFDEAISDDPSTVVTEYAWTASKCDPCPGPVLQPDDYLTLGADLYGEDVQRTGWVVTRLHARYTPDQVGADLVFRKADAISGGNEVRDEDGALIKGARPADRNRFQGRYVIRHEWTGPVDCENPRFGIWGGKRGGSPSTDTAVSPNTRGSAPESAGEVKLAELVKEPVPETDIVPAVAPAAGKVTGPGKGKKPGSTCAGCSASGVDAPALLLLAVGLLVAHRRKR